MRRRRSRGRADFKQFASTEGRERSSFGSTLAEIRAVGNDRPASGEQVVGRPLSVAAIGRHIAAADDGSDDGDNTRAVRRQPTRRCRPVNSDNGNTPSDMADSDVDYSGLRTASSTLKRSIRSSDSQASTMTPAYVPQTGRLQPQLTASDRQHRRPHESLPSMPASRTNRRGGNQVEGYLAVIGDRSSVVHPNYLQIGDRDEYDDDDEFFQSFGFVNPAAAL